MTANASLNDRVVRLPSALDLSTATALANDLLGLRGGAVRLDASGVEKLGGLGLQVLLSARLTWLRDGAPFVLIDPSAAFLADSAALGAGDLNAISETQHG